MKNNPPRNGNSKRSVSSVHGALMFCLLLLSVTTLGAGPSLSLSKVSVDRHSFSPSDGQTLSLRYKVSQPAIIRIRFIDDQGNTVHTARQTIKKAGTQQYQWNGRNDKGFHVAPEAYLYTLSAQSSDGVQSVQYDLSRKTGGEYVYLVKPTVQKNGTINYILPKPARVRLIISGKDAFWPITTLLDWEPQAAGRHQIPWDGWDAGHNFKALDKQAMQAVTYAYSLPKNSVIVTKGKTQQGTATKDTKQSKKKSKEKTPNDTEKAHLRVPIYKTALDKIRPQHIHATHNRAICYNPAIEVQLPKLKKTKSGAAIVSEITPVRFKIADNQKIGKAKPISRVSVFVLVDGVVVERLLSGYEPYQWQLDPSKYKSGEHIITGLFTWREDHFGIVHTKVWTQ